MRVATVGITVNAIFVMAEFFINPFTNITIESQTRIDMSSDSGDYGREIDRGVINHSAGI